MKINNYKKILFFFLGIIFFSLNIYAEGENTTPISRNKILNKYQNDKKVQQIICVNYISDTNAILKMYVRDDTQNKGGWKIILATDAFVGQKGMGKEKEGDLKTPLGDFNVTQAFGIKENPGTDLKYIDINENMYACDENCKYYNKIIDISKIKHQCGGEHLIEYVPQYNYGICFDFNKKNVYPNGSNIFIHVKGNKSYTAGCIAIDEESMITLLKNSTKKTKVCIYENQ